MPIQLAFNTSFSVTCSKDDLSQIPSGCDFVEAYAFMSQHLTRLVPGVSTHAVSAMATLFNENKAVELSTSLINDFPNKSIVAFATFMPEIISPDQARVNEAVHALKLLVQMARFLKQELGHPIQVIELVGGSCIKELRKTGYTTDHVSAKYVAERFAEGELIERLLTNLEPVAEYSASNEAPVFLALELEPGPLLTLFGQPALTRISESIGNHRSASIQSVLGFNLDVPHWDFLSGIQPEWLLQPAQTMLRHRILHAHVSDHHTGHFCDCIPGTLNPEAKFIDWMNALKFVAEEERPPGWPQFSGFISCEMEACKDPRFLDAAFNRVKSWL